MIMAQPRQRIIKEHYRIVSIIFLTNLQTEEAVCLFIESFHFMQSPKFLFCNPILIPNYKASSLSLTLRTPIRNIKNSFQFIAAVMQLSKRFYYIYAQSTFVHAIYYSFLLSIASTRHGKSLTKFHKFYLCRTVYLNHNKSLVKAIQHTFY